MAQFDSHTTKILTGLGALNPGIVLDAANNNVTENTLKTVSSDETILAEATVPVTFTGQAGIEDINLFFNELTLFELPDVSFDTENFTIVEAASGVTPKTKSFPVGDIASITVPSESIPDLSADDDINATLTAADMDIISNAVTQYQMNENRDQLNSAIVGMNYDFAIEDSFNTTPIPNESGFDLSSVQFSSELYQQQVDQYTSAVETYTDTNPENVQNYSSVQVALLCVSGQTSFTLTLAKDGVLIPGAFSMTVPLDPVGSADPFISSTNFFLDANLFTQAITEVDYNLIVSDQQAKATLTGTLTRVKVVYDEAAIDQQVNDYDAAATQYETNIEAYETQKALDIAVNDKIRADAEFGIRDQRLVNSPAGGGSTNYLTPTANEVDAFAVSNGWDVNYEANYDTSGPGGPGGLNERPEDLAEFTEVEPTDETFISNIVYSLPATVVPQ